MPHSHRLHILGASGSGTSTLGAALARALHVPWLDTDTFYWEPTDPPFRDKRPVPDRCALLRAEMSKSDAWVLSGSLVSWGNEFVPRFTTVVFVTLDPVMRMQRLRERERTRYGSVRIAPGGDLHDEHTAFLSWASEYDTGSATGRSRAVHEQWIAALPSQVQVLRVQSEEPVDQLVDEVVRSLRHAPTN
jgi:adenylate kinase family enzyme